jgi:hypothetical protein
MLLAMSGMEERKGKGGKGGKGRGRKKKEGEGRERKGKEGKGRKLKGKEHTMHIGAKFVPTKPLSSIFSAQGVGQSSLVHELLLDHVMPGIVPKGMVHCQERKKADGLAYKNTLKSRIAYFHF